MIMLKVYKVHTMTLWDKVMLIYYDLMELDYIVVRKFNEYPQIIAIYEKGEK